MHHANHPRRRAIAALGLGATLLAVAPTAAHAAIPRLDMEALPDEPVTLPDGFTAAACEGDAPLVCILEEGADVPATIEHLTFSLASYSDLADDLAAGSDLHPALVREMDRHHVGMRADRRETCPDLEYVPDPTVGAVVAGHQGVRWGASMFTVGQERRLVERTVGFLGVRGDDVDVLVAHELNEGACISDEDMAPFRAGGLGRFTATFTGLAARMDLGEGSVAPTPVGRDTVLDADDAVATAIALSQLAVPAGPTDVVLLARDDVFADALASGLLQGAWDAPLLLTGSDALDPRVVAELDRLDPTQVVVLGREAAISDDVVDALVARDHAVLRIGGEDRVATALLIADEVADEVEEVLVVRAFGDGDPSRAFADALGAGALAADHLAPVLLTPGAALDDRVAGWLDGRRVERAVLVGGEAALARPVAQELVEIGIAIDRVDGVDRHATAVELLRRRDLVSADHVDAVVLVDARTATDGLAAALLAHRGGAAVVLADGATLPAASSRWLATANPNDPPVLVCTPAVAAAACTAAGAAMRDG